FEHHLPAASIRSECAGDAVLVMQLLDGLHLSDPPVRRVGAPGDLLRDPPTLVSPSLRAALRILRPCRLPRRELPQSANLPLLEHIVLVPLLERLPLRIGI